MLIAAGVILFGGLGVRADYKEFVDYTRLQTELGGDLPTGAAVKATQVEAPDDNGYYMPDTNYHEFTLKTITDAGSGSAAASSHATTVGRYFYGNITSMAPGIDEIDAYGTNDWLWGYFLRPVANKQPLVCDSRIANHSWISYGISTKLARIDWVVETDEFIQVGGMPNSGLPYDLLCGAYNVISVGRTDGGHATGTRDTGDVYTSGRTKPDLVGPAGATSWATPMVSAAAAMLVETGHSNTSLSNGYLSPGRTGMTIYHAETSEVIKSALMAGADRYTDNASGANITDYTIDTDNGLDHRFGAGQLNVYHSYHVIAGGEQDSIQDGGAGEVGCYGFDYDPSFSRDEKASYYFTADACRDMIMTSLVWNIDIDGGTKNNFDPAATLHDLDLYLYNVSDLENHVLLACSVGAADNTENIFTGLVIGDDYMLEVAAKDGQDDFTWDYGLAWRIVADPETILLPGDANLDGYVDDDDMSLLLNNWLTGRTWDEGDFNLDDFVDDDDLGLLLANWHQSASSASHAPEPATVLLLMLGVPGLLRRRRLTH